MSRAPDMSLSRSSFEELQSIPDHEWTEALAHAVANTNDWRNMVSNHPILAVPERFRTPQLLLEATIATPWIIRVQRIIPPHIVTSEFCLKLVKANCSALVNIPDNLRTTEICRAAIRPLSYETQFHNLLIWVPAAAQTEDLVCEIIPTIASGYAILCYVATQTERICILAVTKRPREIEFVKNQTWSVCEAALTSALASTTPYDAVTDTLVAIREHTLQVGLKALEYGKDIVPYLRNPSDELCLAAMEKIPHAAADVLLIIDNQTVAVCMAAYRHQPCSFCHINVKEIKRSVARLVIADKFMAIQDIGLSTLAMVNICEQLLLSGQFVLIMSGLPYHPFTWSQLWNLAALIKHG